MSLERENYESFWTDADEIIEVRRSNLRRARNAHLLIGSGLGVGATLAVQYLFFWTIGVF